MLRRAQGGLLVHPRIGARLDLDVAVSSVAGPRQDVVPWVRMTLLLRATTARELIRKHGVHTGSIDVWSLVLRLAVDGHAVAPVRPGLWGSDEGAEDRSRQVGPVALLRPAEMVRG